MKKYFLIVPALYFLTFEGQALGRRSHGSAQNTTTESKSESHPGKTTQGSSFTANQILKYADSGVGSPYVWGGSAWSVKNRKSLGADCSGFTQKSWAYPYEQSPETDLPDGKRLSTKEFMSAQDSGYPWTRFDKLSYSDSLPGDAMVRRTSDEGHIFLVSKPDTSGVVTVEARGVKYGIGYSRKSYAYLKSKDYKVIRRK